MNASKLTRSNGNNPCPLCGDISGRDRTNGDIWMCMALADTRSGKIIDGYKVVSHSKDRLWAVLKPDNTTEWTQERRREWEAQKVARQQKARVEEKRKREQALSADERHQLYSKILEQLPLDSATVTDLRRRGFSDEQISRCGFKPAGKWQKLDKKYDIRLPGISENGKSLVVCNDGYLCPLRDFDGKITGMQQRLHNPKDGNRYRWLSTPDRATLKLQPEDENPLAVFHPPGGKPEGIAIIEGVGTKPFLVSQRLNLLTIGASGGQWLSSEKLLAKYINAAIDKYGELPITIIPDAGWALNWQVKQQLASVFDWFKNKFTQSIIYVLDWNQIHKSQGDIDELDDLSIVRRLKLESFLKKYKEVFTENKGFASKRFQDWAKKRVQLTADIVQHEKWLTIPEGIQNECDILLIRKSLGGGKTQALIEFLKPLKTTSLLVGYRNTLLNNSITRANDYGLSALHIKDAKEFTQGSVINFAADDSIKLWGGCADSFFKFNAVINHNPDYFLIHDEICSVLGHLKGGGTLKGRQQQAIDWDVNTIKNSQFSVMMDANLTDREVDFIRLLFPERRIKVLESVYATSPRKFIFLETKDLLKDYTRNPQYLPSQLMEKAKSANKVLWISDSQRSCEIADEILTKHGHKHFRLDGKTSHDELAKQFQSAPVKFLKTENLDSISISPSGESGLSIDLYDYFDAVCFDIRGTVSVNTLTQLSARLRDTDVPIYVACPEFINMTSDPCPYAMKKVEEVINQRVEMLLSQAMQTDSELVNSQFVADMFSEMAKKFANDPWFIESLKDAKELKYEHSNLKLTLKTALAQAGHRVIDLAEAMDSEQHEEVQETKEAVKRREAEKIFNSEDITWEQAQELSKKDVNYDNKCKIRKARLKHQLSGIESTSSWSADFIYTLLLDQPNFLESRWRLKQLEDEELLKSVFKIQKHYNFENGFAPMDAWKSTSTKIESLKLLGVGKIVNSGLFSSQDGWVQEIVNQYYDNEGWFNLIGIAKAKRSLNDDGSLKNLHYVKKMVDKFLDFFGLECKQSERTRNGRTYGTVTKEALDNYLQDIDSCLNTRAKAIIEEGQKLSLKEAADKAEERQRQQQEWEEKHQASLNKRMLESQLTHTHSAVTFAPSIYINQKGEMSRTEVYNIATTETEQWNQPEFIADVTQMLESCSDDKMLAELRQCNIPVEIFKIAARNLPCEKREQIRAWVLAAG